MKIQVKKFGPIPVTSPEYLALKEKLQASGHKHFQVWHEGGPGQCIEGEFEVEEKHLFSDQTNVVEGYRIHDWYDAMSYPTKFMRHGHYVENLDELNALRSQYFKCGYCGAQDKEEGWCEKCRGSEYLEPKDYPLTRKRRITEPTPRGRDRNLEVPQSVINDIRIQQAKMSAQKIENMIKGLIESEKAKVRNQQQWIKFLEFARDQGVSWADIQNAIHYPHTASICFGWRTPMTPEKIEALTQQTQGWTGPQITFKGA